jgi:acetaldehyde dehydrogenase/alcohol dehydrogenase
MLSGAMPALPTTWTWAATTEEEKVEKLVEAIEDLKRKLNIPMTIREVLNDDDKAFYDHVEEMADQAFDDQCTGANPRYPLIRDLKELYTLAYRGCRLDASLFHPEVVERHVNGSAAGTETVSAS